MNTTVQNYYNINSDSNLDYFDNLNRSTGVVIPIKMYVSNEPSLRSGKPLTNYTQYDLNDTYLGPFTEFADNPTEL